MSGSAEITGDNRRHVNAALSSCVVFTVTADKKGTKSVVFDDLLLLEIDPELFSLLYKGVFLSTLTVI